MKKDGEMHGGTLRRRDIATQDCNDQLCTCILETAMDGFWLVNPEGCIIEANAAAAQMAGYSRDEMRHLRTSDIEVHQSAQMKGKSIDTAMTMGIERFETIHRCKDGTVIAVEVSCRRLRMDGGLIAVFVHDMTGRKMLEEKLIHSAEYQQKRLAQELHDGLCQDLKSLEFEAAVLEDFLAGHDSTAAARAAVIGLKANRAVRTLYAIMRGLLPSGLKAARFAAAIDALARGAEADGGLRIERRIQDALEAPGDQAAYQLYRIAQEALENALHHAKAGSVAIVWEMDEGQLVLAVEDDGVGFDIKKARSACTGMGLMVMRSRANAIGAAFDIQSRPGKGTWVQVRCDALQAILCKASLLEVLHKG